MCPSILVLRRGSVHEDSMPMVILLGMCVSVTVVSDGKLGKEKGKSRCPSLELFCHSLRTRAWVTKS